MPSSPTPPTPPSSSTTPGMQSAAQTSQAPTTPGTQSPVHSAAQATASQTQTVAPKKNRDSNMELLRILAILLIICYHLVSVVKGQLESTQTSGGTYPTYFDHPAAYSRILFLDCLMTFGNIGNNLFILISGFYLATRESQRIKAGDISKKLLLQMGFSVLLLVCVPTLIHAVAPQYTFTMQPVNIFNGTGCAWFVGYYFLIILCGKLFLNDFLARLDARQYGLFLLALFGVTQFSYIIGMESSLMSDLPTVVTGVFFYALGGCIRKYDVFSRVRGWLLFALIACSYALIWLSESNRVNTRVQTSGLQPGDGGFAQSLTLYPNYSIVVVIVSICTFELFHRIHVPGNPVVTFLGRATFMVYLVHQNDVFYDVWRRRDWVTTLYQGFGDFCVKVLACLLVTFVIGVASYALYLALAALIRRCRPLFLKS